MINLGKAIEVSSIRTMDILQEEVVYAIESRFNKGMLSKFVGDTEKYVNMIVEDYHDYI